MRSKPKHLAPEYGAQFQDQSVAEAYPNRPPYPAKTFAVLRGLIADAPLAVLDVGCGTGDIARRLAPLVERVDAVDISAAMIAAGRRQPGGNASNLTWVHAPVEDAALAPPYSLITAGESLHWLAWDIVFPRFAEVLTSRGVLAIVERDWDLSAARGERLSPIIGRCSTNRAFRPFDLPAELTSRGLFEQQGQRRTGPEPWRPTISEYIECRHSQNGLSRERMGSEAAAAYDAETRAALLDLCREGALELREDRLALAVAATITWGRPLRSAASRVQSRPH
jgi:SAM-dependent methyltransferase